jgi:hypothetical protein
VLGLSSTAALSESKKRISGGLGENRRRRMRKLIGEKQVEKREERLKVK